MNEEFKLDLTDKTKEELLELASKTTALKDKLKFRLIDCVMPETGKYARDKYHKAMEFFAAGKTHRFRMFGGPNGSGKSFTGALELTYHLTGEYPEWWPGMVLDCPKHAWIVCESATLFKGSLQRTLLGSSLNEEDYGTGLIPKDRLGNKSGWPNVPGAVISFEVKHKKGHWVTVEIKSSDQKSENLQAANLDILFEDEEPPLDTHTECLFRLRGSPTKPPGILMLMYTPLKGLTNLTLQFLDQGQYPNNGKGGQSPTDPDKYIVHIDIDDIPHMTEVDRRAAINNCPPHQREARLHGRPGLGAGKIYPISEDFVFVKPFKIPDYWPRCFSLDFGWHCTCVLWGAKDPHTNTIYIYSEYYHGEESPQVHALNIRERGAWISGVCDPSGGGRSHDGELMVSAYRKYGIKITPADNALYAGISRVLDYLQSGRLKIFDNLENTKKEFRLYRYDTKNPNEPAPNQADHAMDNLRYITSRFDYVAQTQDDAEGFNIDNDSPKPRRDSHTGY